MWEVCVCALQLHIHVTELQKHATEVCEIHEELVMFRFVGEISALVLHKRC